MEQLENKAKHPHQQARLINIKKRSSQKYIIVGNYRIGKKIGSGAYGTVHQAFGVETGQKFAVKIVYFSESNYESVMNQVNINKKLCHQNIVEVVEIIQSQGKIYIIMEFCENGELFEYVKAKGPMNEGLAAKIFMQVYSAVRYLHQNKIAHRDIKTENVLLDENMNAKLIDFGFSKEYTSENPMMQTFCGSPSYISPQIIKKQKYNGQKVDVWSLGITLYIMLEAAEPFYAESNGDTKFRIINYQWSAPRYSTHQAKQLYEWIFVPSICRISLMDIEKSSFFEKYFRHQQSSHKKSRIQSKSTQKTERLSTGETSLVLLPGISTANKNNMNIQCVKTGSKQKKQRLIVQKETMTGLKLNLKTARNKFDWKAKSAETKTQRNQFRVKITPSKLHKKQTELNIAFFKRQITSSFNQY